MRVVPAPRDPSEVSATSPHASTIDPLGAARATPDLDVPAGVILDPGTSLDHVVVAADGSDIAVAWVAAGQACFRAVTSGGLEGGATRCAGAGVTSVAVARADTGWLLLYVDAAGVQLAAVDASGTPGSPEMVSVGSGLGDPFVASAGRSVQVGFRRGDELLAGGRCGP